MIFKVIWQKLGHNGKNDGTCTFLSVLLKKYVNFLNFSQRMFRKIFSCKVLDFESCYLNQLHNTMYTYVSFHRSLQNLNWHGCFFLKMYLIDNSYTAQKMKFSINDFFSKFDQIRSVYCVKSLYSQSLFRDSYSKNVALP